MMHKTRHYICPKVFVISFIAAVSLGLILWHGSDRSYKAGYVAAYIDIIDEAEGLK